MNKRKKYIVDKGFQLKTAFGILGITTVLSLIILIVITLSAVYNNNEIDKIIKTEDKIFQALTAISTRNSKEAVDPAIIGNMSRDHIENFVTTKRIIQYNRILLLSLIIFIILQGIILFVIMIRKTHRISGPLYVMSNYFKEMIDGKYPDPRPLRKKDDLLKFYDLVTQFVKMLKEREKKKK